MADHNPAPRRDPTAKQALQNIVATQRQRQAERARNPYQITIDDPPDSGQYVAIMESLEGRDVLIRRISVPPFGEVSLTLHEGRVTKVDVKIGEKM